MSTIYLYIKQHQITKLLYFGKTTRQYIESYSGSGKYWKRHLKQHGTLIDTLCIWEFEDQIECTDFAIQFSKENDIVKSSKWANFIEENGLNGGYSGTNMLGKHHSEESKAKMINAATGRVMSESTKKLLSEQRKNKKRSKESCLKQSNTLKEKGIYTCDQKKATEAWRGQKHTEQYKKEQSQRAKKIYENFSEEKRNIMKIKMGNISRGTKWWNNGLINVKKRDCPEGFIRGRLLQR